MFVLKKRESFQWPVKFRIAIDGRYEDHEFKAEFKRISQSRIDELFGAGGDRSEKISDDEFVREALIGWDGVTLENGDAVPFNQDTLTSLLDVPGVRTAIVRAFFNSISGLAEKN